MGRVTTRCRAQHLTAESAIARPETLAVEEPMEIRVNGTAMTVTMRRGGAQHRFIRMQLQVLSLATTQPEIYGSFAVTAVHAMIQPIAAAFERAGFTPDEAAARATLVVSGLRGLCQDLLVTDDRKRVDAAAERLINAAIS
jgi:formate dehydrogenase assembly factor FdhD